MPASGTCCAAARCRLRTQRRHGCDWKRTTALIFRPPGLGTGIRLENKLPGVIVGSGDRQTCFLVDELIDELDVVVKNLGPLLGKVDTAIGRDDPGQRPGGGHPRRAEPAGRGAQPAAAAGQLGRAWQADPRAQPTAFLVVDD